VIPPLYADEDYPMPTIQALRERGFSVTAAVHVAPGQDDLSQMRRAATRNELFVSLNYTERRVFATHAATLRDEGMVSVAAILLPHEPPTERLLLRTLLMLHWREGRVDLPDVLTWHHLQRELIAGTEIPGFSPRATAVALGQTAGDW
jgi:hypothetical protein